MAESTQTQALLVMDVQPGIVERMADKDAYLARVRQAVDGAHRAGLPVIYVVVGFRPGFPEISPENKSFSALAGTASMVDPRPVLEPTAEDVVVVKRRVSAFTGSDLEVVLRAHGIRHLALSGIATSGVVLSTLREAADKDYRLSVLSDLCADFDEEVHRVLTEKIFPRQADVLTGGEWLSRL